MCMSDLKIEIFLGIFFLFWNNIFLNLIVNLYRVVIKKCNNWEYFDKYGYYREVKYC